eukprot:475408-Prorocentrum_minimum.AAC.2
MPPPPPEAIRGTPYRSSYTVLLKVLRVLITCVSPRHRPCGAGAGHSWSLRSGLDTDIRGPQIQS